MKKYGKIILGVFTLFIIIGLSACGGNTENTYVIGLNGTASPQWEYVKKQAEKEGIKIELKYFADYVQPNRALVDGELAANAFQTVSFMKAFNKDNKDAIVPIGTTILAPMGIYSKKIKNLSELKNGAKITIPNDISNQGRALKLLAQNKVIELKDPEDDYASINDVTYNPLNIEITAMAANQLPPTLGDVDISVINNGVAADAGYKISEAIAKEDALAKSYINVIAVRKEDKDNPKLQRIVALFQTPEVAEIIKKDTGENSIPTFVPLKDIGY